MARKVNSMPDPVTPPDRTLDQRRAALNKGNAIRSARKDLKAVIRDDRELGVLLDVIARPALAIKYVDAEPGFVDTMRAYDLLLNAQGIGRVAANRIVSRCRIAPSKTLAGLSVRQRNELTTELGAIARRRRRHPEGTKGQHARVADPTNDREERAA